MSCFDNKTTAYLRSLADAARRAHCRAQADLDQVEAMLPAVADHLDRLASQPGWLFELPRDDALEVVRVLTGFARLHLTEHSLRDCYREAEAELTNRGSPLENDP